MSEKIQVRRVALNNFDLVASKTAEFTEFRSDTRGALLIFAKAPIAGQVKTRLIAELGPTGAMNIYLSLLQRTLCLAQSFRNYPTQLWCSPNASHVVFEQCSHEFEVSLHNQYGQDLGQRMDNAIQHVLQNRDFALLIGCDCPVLKLDDLVASVHALERGFDCVLGPAEDGGYVLIGLRRPEPGIFNGIDWGSDRVYHQTRSSLERLGLSYFELPMRWDLDRPDDLARYRHLPDFKAGN